MSDSYYYIVVQLMAYLVDKDWYNLILLLQNGI